MYFLLGVHQVLKSVAPGGGTWNLELSTLNENMAFWVGNTAVVLATEVSQRQVGNLEVSHGCVYW